MAFAKRETRVEFRLVASGELGEFATLDFFEIDPVTRARAHDPALTIDVFKKHFLALAGYQVIGRRGGTMLFKMRADPTPGSTLKDASMKSMVKSDPLARSRDRALALAVASAFFAKRANFDINDAVNSLTFYLAVGSGEDVTSISDVWMKTNVGYQSEAERYVRNLGTIIREDLDLDRASA